MGTFDTTGSATITNVTQAGLGSVYVDNTASVTWVGGGTTTVTGPTPVGSLIFVRNAGHLTMSGVSVSSFAYYAAILYDQASLTVNDSTITGSGESTGGSGPGEGGAIWLGASQNGVPAPALAVNLSATSTTFDNNAFYGISSPRGTVAVSGTGSSVSGNGAGATASGYAPGGVLLTDAASVTSLTMRSVAVGGNTGNQIVLTGTSASTFDLGTATTAGGVTRVLPFFGGDMLNVTNNAIAHRNIDRVGYPREFVVYFGISVITLGILTLIPATSFLGAILSTAWMGGAIAAHVRVRDTLSVTIGIVIIPVCIWVAFGLRHLPEMHALLGF